MRNKRSGAGPGAVLLSGAARAACSPAMLAQPLTGAASGRGCRAGTAGAGRVVPAGMAWSMSSVAWRANGPGAAGLGVTVETVGAARDQRQ